jgi:VWFA-related protein
MTLRLVAPAVLAALAAATITAQQLPQQDAPPVFRSGVEAVQLNVFVTDEDDNPVSGLTIDDFEVLENGRPQAISTFDEVSMPVERAAPRPFDAESDVRTNAREHRHVYLILLGEMPPGAALQARVRVRQFLTEHFGDNDLAAVFVLTAFNTKDGQDFTSSRRLLLEAVDKFSGRGGDEVKPMPWVTTRDLWQHFELMARIPGGRKSVLVFGRVPAKPFDIIDYHGGVLGLEDEYAHAAIAAASRANIPIYPINPTGEVAFDPDSRALAALTGAFAHIGGNDYTPTFERLVRETSTYYVLGFDSSVQRKDGRHIELEARVRRPGLRVRSRSGYVEQLKYIQARMPPEPRRTPVETSLASPLATTGVPMQLFAAAYRKAASGKNAMVTLAVEIDADLLQFATQADRFVAPLEIRHLATDAAAKIHPEFRHRTLLGLDGDTYQHVRDTGLRLVSQFELPPGRFQLRVASANGDRHGGVVYDLEVPDFGKGPLTLSGVTLTSRSAADVLTLRPERMGRPSQKAKSCRERVCGAGVTLDGTLVRWDDGFGDEPHLRDVLPAPPSTRRAFAAGETVLIYGEVYDNNKRVSRDPAYAIALDATLHAADGAVVRQVSDTRGSREPRRPSGGHGFTLRLPLDGLPTGEYVLRIEAASSRDGEHRPSRTIPVRVR